MLFWSAFLLGLLGSTHCVGMCGPIAMALPLSHSDRLAILWRSLVYHFGRILTYGLLGLFLGALGQGILLAGWQKWFSVGIGALMLLMAFFTVDLENQVLTWPGMRTFYQRIQRGMRALLKRRGIMATMGLGILNGFLPCGMVFMALAGSITVGHIWGGSVFMVAFGLGTLPLMFSVTIAGQYLPRKAKFYLRKFAPYVLAAFALLLIVRGFQVQVPKSLVFWEMMQDPVMCH